MLSLGEHKYNSSYAQTTRTPITHDMHLIRIRNTCKLEGLGDSGIVLNWKIELLLAVTQDGNDLTSTVLLVLSRAVDETGPTEWCI